MLIKYILNGKFGNSNEFIRKKEYLISDIIHSGIKDYFPDSCFYYSAGSDATPIIGCLDLTNVFVYCDIQECADFYDALHLLKKKLRDNGNQELLYCSLSKNWFGLKKKTYSGHYMLRYSYSTERLKADFSLWKNGTRFFVLIYVDFDNNAFWQNTYLKYKLRPKIICDICYEGGVDFYNYPLTADMMPQYWLGYAEHMKCFVPTKQLKYYGEYGGDYFTFYENMDYRR